MKQDYYNKEHMAKVVGRSLPISTKYSIEIANYIRKKKLANAKQILADTIALKKAIPFRRFLSNRSHQTKVGPGKFPQKAAQHILDLLESVEANAQFKGLNTSDLIISTMIVNKGAEQWHSGRQRRRKMKSTHIEIVVKESKEKPKNKKDKETKKEVKEAKK